MYISATMPTSTTWRVVFRSAFSSTEIPLKFHSLSDTLTEWERDEISLSLGGACETAPESTPCSMIFGLCSMISHHLDPLFTVYSCQISYYSGANVKKHKPPTTRPSQSVSGGCSMIFALCSMIVCHAYPCQISYYSGLERANTLRFSTFVPL